MDVTTDNFAEMTLVFQAQLREADFIAIDLEMSGLRLPNDRRFGGGNYADLVPSQYRKYREVIRKFDMIQVGIAVFSNQDDGSINGGSVVSSFKQSVSEGGALHYSASPFNFYVLPRQMEGFQHPTVTICPETCEFHTKQ